MAIGGHREGLSEGEVREVRGIAYDVLSEIQRKFDDKMERLVDGAQASINTALLLHGDAALQIKGAIPELRDGLAALEHDVRALQSTTDTQHRENSDRLEALEAGQKQLEAGQYRTRRALVAVFRWVTKKDDDGRTTTSRLAVLWAVVLGGVHQTVMHVPVLKRWALWLLR